MTYNLCDIMLQRQTFISFELNSLISWQANFTRKNHACSRTQIRIDIFLVELMINDETYSPFILRSLYNKLGLLQNKNWHASLFCRDLITY